MAFIQAIAGDNSPSTTGTTLALTLPSNSTAGSAIFVCTFGGSTTGVADDKSQTYTKAGSVGSFVDLWYFLNSVVGVSVITVTSSGAPMIGFAAEESGVLTSLAEDKYAAPVVQAGVTAFTSGVTGTTIQATEVLYGVHASNTGLGLTWTPGSGWAAITGTNITGGKHSHSVDGDELYMQRRAVSATGTYESDGTVSSANNIGSLIVTFKQSATAGNIAWIRA
jgi:hypothetical protein